MTTLMTTEVFMTPSRQSTWLRVCALDALPVERGTAALVCGDQIALVRTYDGTVYAVQNLDPFSRAMVMSRGLVGTRGPAPTIASPMYKQVFDLRTGECLDPIGKEPLDLRTWPVRIVDGQVEVGSTGELP